MPGTAFLQVLYEKRQYIFGLAGYKMVYVIKPPLFVPGVEKGTTGNNLGP